MSDRIAYIPNRKRSHGVIAFVGTFDQCTHRPGAIEVGNPLESRLPGVRLARTSVRLLPRLLTPMPWSAPLLFSRSVTTFESSRAKVFSRRRRSLPSGEALAPFLPRRQFARLG